MNVTIARELENLVTEKVNSGEYVSVDAVIDAALRLFREREEDRAVVMRVNRGEPIPDDDRFQERLEILLQEAEDSGAPTEMAEQDWEEIRREGLARLKSRKAPA